MKFKFLTQRAYDLAIKEAYQEGRNDERADNLRDAMAAMKKQIETEKALIDCIGELEEKPEISADDIREGLAMRREI